MSQASLTFQEPKHIVALSGGKDSTALAMRLMEVAPRDLDGLIEKFNALPNHRQRWCTRLLKIEPCLAFIARNSPAILYVGLRADEMEREGIYGSLARETYPLREWGWGLREVLGFLKERGITIPKRTDCRRCYGQRLIEWKNLLLDHPDIYEEAVQQEIKTGHTFRSASRDTWPASLADLRVEFQSGRKVRGEDRVDENEEGAACRVCKL